MKPQLPVLFKKAHARFAFSFVRPCCFAATISLALFMNGCTKETSSVLPQHKLAASVDAGSTIATGLQPISLGVADSFTILTKTGITTTGVTKIQGNIGTSPIASTALTGFGLAVSSDGSYATSSLISGKAYGPDYAGATPATMTAAVNAMEAAFISGNALAPTQPLESYAGDISGKSLSAGVYNWATGLMIADNSTVTLTGSATDVYVFQIGTGLTVGSNTRIILGNVLTTNVFWIVGSAATFGTNADFSGTILAKTLISLNTGDLVTGRLYAQTAVTMIANTVNRPPVIKAVVLSVVGQPLFPGSILYNGYALQLASDNYPLIVVSSGSFYSGASLSSSTKFSIYDAGNGQVVIKDNSDNELLYANYSWYGDQLSESNSQTISPQNLFTMKIFPGRGFTLQASNGRYLGSVSRQLYFTALSYSDVDLLQLIDPSTGTALF